METSELSPAEKLARKHPRKAAGNNKIPQEKAPPTLLCKVAEVRVGINLAQKDAAKALKMSQSMLSRIESGSNVTLPIALRIARFYGRSVESLWEERTNSSERGSKKNGKPEPA